MLFVLKSLFWLGLVFFIAPSTGAHDPQRTEAGRIAAQATAEAAGAIAASLPAVALEVCKQAPRECVNGALQLQAGAKPARTPAHSTATATTTATTRRVSADTLTGRDREPGWRGNKPRDRQI